MFTVARFRDILSSLGIAQLRSIASAVSCSRLLCVKRVSSYKTHDGTSSFPTDFITKIVRNRSSRHVILTPTAPYGNMRALYSYIYAYKIGMEKWVQNMKRSLIEGYHHVLDLWEGFGDNSPSRPGIGPPAVPVSGGPALPGNAPSSHQRLQHIQAACHLSTLATHSRRL